MIAVPRLVSCMVIIIDEDDVSWSHCRTPQDTRLSIAELPNPLQKRAIGLLRTLMQVHSDDLREVEITMTFWPKTRLDTKMINPADLETLQSDALLTLTDVSWWLWQHHIFKLSRRCISCEQELSRNKQCTTNRCPSREIHERITGVAPRVTGRTGTRGK